MPKSRLEAFSDGVLAILITIMVLELKPPKGDTSGALLPLGPVFLSYILSFVFLGIYWNNHHHMLHATHRVNGRIMWANHHLLFWLSLVPFVTAWMGSNDFAALPTALYGAVLLMSGAAYWILQRAIIDHHGPDAAISQALSHDFKGNLSLVLYAIAIPTAFYSQLLANAIYVVVAIMWLRPDQRIEKKLLDKQEHEHKK